VLLAHHLAIKMEVLEGRVGVELAEHIVHKLHQSPSKLLKGQIPLPDAVTTTRALRGHT
jgi:hypothetical protein